MAGLGTFFGLARWVHNLSSGFVGNIPQALVKAIFHWHFYTPAVIFAIDTLTTPNNG